MFSTALLHGKPESVILVSLLTPLVPLAVSSGQVFSSPTVAGVLVYGVPDATVEDLIGGGRVSSLITLSLGHRWITGDDFERTLVGQRVDSGNAYTIRDGDPLYDPSNPVTHDDILQDGGVRLPLKVIETQQDIHLVFTRNGRQFRTEFGENQEKYLQPIPEIWTGRTGAFPHYGYIGKYVLENGIMASNGDHGWVPAPITANSLIRINSQQYSVSLVIVYSFPFD